MGTGSSTPTAHYAPSIAYRHPYNVQLGNSNPELWGQGQLRSYYQPGYSWDPAVGCNKNFVGSYKCGKNTPKSISTSQATGTVIAFDCSAEHNTCTNFRLELTTSGELRFTDRAGNAISASTPNGTAAFTTNNDSKKTNESLNPGQLPGDIAKLNAMVLNGKLPGLPGELNLKRAHVKYMHPTQSLVRGEYLCSETGNCFLVLTSSGALEVRALKIKSTIQTAGDNKNKFIGTHSDAVALYELEGLNVDNLGKVANISIDGKRRMYSNGQLALGSKYVEIQGTDSAGRVLSYDNPGNALETITNDTGAIDYCFDQCSNRPDCGGFAVSTADTGTCQLKTTGMFPVGDRVQSNSAHLYKRLYAPKPVSESCSKPDNSGVVAIDSVLFEHYPIDKADPRMSRSTLCGVDQIVETPSSDFASAAANLTSIYDSIMNGIASLIKKQTIYNLIRDDPAMNVEEQIGTYTTTTNEIGKHMEREETVKGAEEDTRIELISETYKYILWSILAIAIIIAIVFYGDIGSYPTNISALTDVFKPSSTESS